MLMRSRLVVTRSLMLVRFRLRGFRAEAGCGNLDIFALGDKT